MNRQSSLSPIWTVVATGWREVLGFVAIKLLLVGLASRYRGQYRLPEQQIREALLKYFEHDTAAFLASLEPAFLFLLLGSVLSISFVAVMFGAVAPIADGVEGVREDLWVLPGALLACELAAGLAATVLLVYLVPNVTLSAALERQALIAAVTLLSALPATAAMIPVRAVTQRRIALFAAGLVFVLGFRYVALAAPAARWISQRGIESLLMTGEVDRFAMGALLSCGWAASFVLVAIAIARRRTPVRRSSLRITAAASTSL